MLKPASVCLVHILLCTVVDNNGTYICTSYLSTKTAMPVPERGPDFHLSFVFGKREEKSKTKKLQHLSTAIPPQDRICSAVCLLAWQPGEIDRTKQFVLTMQCTKYTYGDCLSSQLASPSRPRNLWGSFSSVSLWLTRPLCLCHLSTPSPLFEKS